MDKTQKQEIIENFKKWWRDDLATAHKQNTLKLVNLNEFTINPFLWSYLAYYLEGKGDPKALAKVLIYPRVLGTSVNTSFGQRFQNFITKYFKGTFGSSIPGIDIEFEDKLDGRRKYCQIKAGPNVVNRDDVQSVNGHFREAKARARTNHLMVVAEDYMFCLLYGEKWEWNGFVKEIDKEYIVVSGKDFWHRFTGDEDFYSDLIKAIGEIAKEYNMKEAIEEVVDKLADEIKRAYPEAID